MTNDVKAERDDLEVANALLHCAVPDSFTTEGQYKLDLSAAAVVLAKHRAAERDAIVAWLRGRADAIEALTDKEGVTGQPRKDMAIMAKARRIEADAIESGQHLQEKDSL